MNDEDNISQTRECGADVAAYALGALTPEEAEGFRRHLETCVVCRDELSAFQEVIDVLPMSAPPHPAPRGLRRRVLRAIESEPALGSTSERAPSRRSRLSRSLVPRPALAFGAALALAVLAFTGIRLGASSTAAPPRIIHAQVIGHGTAELQLSRDHAELVVHHFSPPPAGQIYEVWVRRANRAPAPTTALFSVTAGGDGNIDVPGSLRGVDQVMVTAEPAGGSVKPTHAAVLRANLPT